MRQQRRAPPRSERRNGSSTCGPHAVFQIGCAFMCGMLFSAMMFMSFGSSGTHQQPEITYDDDELDIEYIERCPIDCLPHEHRAVEPIRKPDITPARQIIFGCGTGRCGTVSLKFILDEQDNARVTHEQFPIFRWDEVDRETAVANRLAQIRSHEGTFVGDVQSGVLPFVEEILRQEPTALFVCLKRDRQEVIDSFMKKTRGRNHWQIHDGLDYRINPQWDVFFPKFKCVKDKPDAIGKYWDLYYDMLDVLMQKYPDNIRLWDTNDLHNNLTTQTDMLKWLGFPNPKPRVECHNGPNCKGKEGEDHEHHERDPDKLAPAPADVFQEHW